VQTCGDGSPSKSRPSSSHVGRRSRSHCRSVLSWDFRDGFGSTGEVSDSRSVDREWLRGLLRAAEDRRGPLLGRQLLWRTRRREFERIVISNAGLGKRDQLRCIDREWLRGLLRAAEDRRGPLLGRQLLWRTRRREFERIVISNAGLGEGARFVIVIRHEVSAQVSAYGAQYGEGWLKMTVRLTILSSRMLK
jgi:hypothetical protein